MFAVLKSCMQSLAYSAFFFTVHIYIYISYIMLYVLNLYLVVAHIQTQSKCLTKINGGFALHSLHVCGQIWFTLQI